MEISIVYSEPEQIKNLIQLSDDIEVTLLDENNYKQRRNAFKVKGSVAARLTPLIVIKEDGKITKAFYREEFKDPIEKFNNWIKEYDTSKKLDLEKDLRND